MRLQILPQPGKIKYAEGHFAFPSGQNPGRFTSTSITRSLADEEYELAISIDGIKINAGSERGLFYAERTLAQILEQCPGGKAPCLLIRDNPDFAKRGILYDVTRGRVPKMKNFLEMVDRLADFKINHLQLYIEHAFRFKRHPLVHRGSSPLTPDNIRRLDQFCRERNIELVPALASLSHMSNILTLPPYRHMAEDRGAGEYISTESKKMPAWFKGRKGWSLAPANPDTYSFLEDIFDELLPCFSSDRINVCCDEVWDLGLGQSHSMFRRKGKAGLFVYHVKKLRELARKHGRKIMIWGDMANRHPEIIEKLPRDVTVLDWAYDAGHRFGKIRRFTDTGLDTWACPGTSSWTSLFPRIHEAAENIHGFATAGRKHGATGLLTTDWGDGGHCNFMELSWYGYLYGAEQAWNSNADGASFTVRFCRIMLGIDSPRFVKALEQLGEITQLSIPPYYQSIWHHVLFAPPESDIFKGLDGRLTAALGRRTIKKLDEIRSVIAKHDDPMGILPYWIFAVDMMICSARKLSFLCRGANDTRTNRNKLRRELMGLTRQFEKLWLERNRRSQIDIVLGNFKSAIDAL